MGQLRIRASCWAGVEGGGRQSEVCGWPDADSGVCTEEPPVCWKTSVRRRLFRPAGSGPYPVY